MWIDGWTTRRRAHIEREKKKRSKTLSQTTQVKAKTRSGGRQQQQQQKTPTTGVVYAAQNGVRATSDSWRLSGLRKVQVFFLFGRKKQRFDHWRALSRARTFRALIKFHSFRVPTDRKFKPSPDRRGKRMDTSDRPAPGTTIAMMMVVVVVCSLRLSFCWGLSVGRSMRL